MQRDRARGYVDILADYDAMSAAFAAEHVVEGQRRRCIDSFDEFAHATGMLRDLLHLTFSSRGNDVHVQRPLMPSLKIQNNQLGI